MTTRTQGVRVRRPSDEILIEREICETDFTALPNGTVNDETISFAAKGLLWYICSRPATWKVIPAHIRAVGKLSLPAARKLIAALLKAGYGCRELIKDDRGKIIGTKYRFASRPKWREQPDPPPAEPSPIPSEVSAVDAVSRFSVERTPRQMENASPVSSNDRYKSNPPSPPSSDARPPSTESRASEPNLETDSEPPGGEAVPSVIGLPRETAAVEVSPGTSVGIADAGTRDAATLATSQREKASAKPTPDAARFDRWSHKLGKRAGDRSANWTAYTEADESDLAECDRLIDALVASIESHGARMPPLHKIIRGKLWQSIPPPKPVEPKPHFVPKSQGGYQQYRNDNAEAAVCSVTGAKAVREGWVLELYEFVRSNRRQPDALECNRLYAKGRESLRFDVETIVAGKPSDENAKLGFGLCESRMQRRQKFGDMAKAAATGRGENLTVPTTEYWVKELASEATATAPVREPEPEYIEALEF